MHPNGGIGVTTNNMAELSKINDLKIAVVHDHLGWMGGGERTALTIALGLEADFITAYSNEKTFAEYQQAIGSKLKILTIKSKIFDKEVVRFFWMRYVFWRARRQLAAYDVLIASGQTATEAVAKYANSAAVKILYNHTPPRRVFDLFESSRANYKWFLRPLFTIFAKWWKYNYIKAIKRVDYNIANSENIKQRFHRFTGFEVNEVLWPPIETSKFSWLGQGDYYLSWARVDENKRVELIVEAFKKRPDKKLIIASGGPNLEAVRRLAADYENIQVIGWQSDEDLKQLVGNCIAAIYIPRDEDAGMTHLEANAAGKPVLGVDEGGLSESIIDRNTGIIIKSHPTVADVLDGLDQLTSEWCISKKDLCIEHAAKYGRKLFEKRFREIIVENNPCLPIFGIDASRWTDHGAGGADVHTGVEVYTKGIILALLKKLQGKFRIRLYTPEIITELDARMQRVIPGQRLWTICGLSAELKKNPPAHFYTPGYFIPASAPTNSYATIHDVLFRKEPARYPLKERLWQRVVTHWNIKRAKKIFTVSMNSLNDLVKFYQLPIDHIAIAPVGHERWVGIDQDLKREKYLLYVGRVEKKKSISLLIKAFALLSAKLPEYELIIAGKPGYGHEEVEVLIKELGLKEKVTLLGYVDDKTKIDLLTRAAVFVQPSSNEGSSIPVLEAWNAHTPVLVSDCAIMKEIGGGAVQYFKTEDADDLARQLEILISDNDKQQALIAAGEERLANFSWEKSAEAIMKNI